MSSPQGSVVAVSQKKKKCKPFILEVMVYTPEAGYRAEVVVERACAANNDSLWKFVFDLYKKKEEGDGFDQLVHVSYRGLNQQENAAIAGMVGGLGDAQEEKLSDLFEASKDFNDDPSSANQTVVLGAAKAVVTAK